MGNFQQNDAADDENDAEPAVKGGTVAENQNAEQKRSHGADTRPNGVGDADGNMFLCQIKECAAQGHGSHREDDPDDFMLRQMRHFKTKRPADFKQRRRNQINPGHVVLLAGYIVLKTRKKRAGTAFGCCGSFGVFSFCQEQCSECLWHFELSLCRCGRCPAIKTDGVGFLSRSGR